MRKNARSSTIDRGWPKCQLMSVATTAAKSKIASIMQEMATLSPDQLDKLLLKVVALRLEKRRLVLPDRESALLKTINRGLPPGKRDSYRKLREKLRRQNLTASERVELIRLSDELESLAVARLRALMELAAMRKTTVQKLMKQMEIEPVAYASAA